MLKIEIRAHGKVERISGDYHGGELVLFLRAEHGDEIRIRAERLPSNSREELSLLPTGDMEFVIKSVNWSEMEGEQ